MSAVPERSATELFERIASTVEAARGYVARSVNTAMVHAYWHIGREIIEVEQQGEERAAYGEGVLRDLAVRLGQRFGRGFSEPNLRNMRQFYLTYRDGSAVPGELGGPPKRLAPPSASGGAEIRSAAHSESPDILFPPNLGWTHHAILMRVRAGELREAVLRMEGAEGLAKVARSSRRGDDLRAWCRSPVEAADWKAALAAFEEASELVADKENARGELLDGAALAACPKQAHRPRAFLCLLKGDFEPAAELVAACLTCDRSPKALRWVASIRTACRRSPALRAELDQHSGSE